MELPLHVIENIFSSTSVLGILLKAIHLILPEFFHFYISEQFTCFQYIYIYFKWQDKKTAEKHLTIHSFL